MATPATLSQQQTAPNVAKLALFSRFGDLEKRIDGVEGIDSALRINTILQTTLDPDNVIRLFAKEIMEIAPYDTLTYRNPGHNVEVKLGQAGRHSCSYRLVVREEQLGEITFRRNKKYSTKEMELIENLLCGLVYPLRNSLHYRSALQTALRDPLTGISNRAAMDMAMLREIEMARRHGTPLSLMVIDIDHFKNVNDTLGHAAGDYVLTMLTKVVAGIIRKTDMFFRYGGEEFVVICNTGGEGAKLLAERIRKGIEKAQCNYNGAQISLTVSLGIASLNADDSYDTLFKKADQALYRAKSDGRNCVRCSQS